MSLLALGDARAARARRLARALLPALALAVASISMTRGALHVPLSALLEPDALTQVQQHVLLYIRGPRVLMGALIGASLAISGASLQGIFRNPLADPGLIGVSSGAALATVLWIVFGAALASAASPWVAWAVPLAAFTGGLATTALVLRLATRRGRVDMPTMLLAGVAISALAGALIGLATTMSNEQQLRTLTLWTMGSLAAADWTQVALVAAFVLPGCAGLLRCAHALDVMALGEREAHHLGVPVALVRRLIVALVALIVGAGVGFTGMIGFVGLIVPHLLRLLVGPSHRALLPLSMWAGAALLMGADLAARTLLSPAELPIGVVTALIGAPFFLALLMQQRTRGGLYDA